MRIKHAGIIIIIIIFCGRADAIHNSKPGHPESPNFHDQVEAEEAGGQSGGQIQSWCRQSYKFLLGTWQPLYFISAHIINNQKKYVFYAYFLFR